MKVFRVKDEELDDVLGEQGLINFATEQYDVLKDVDEENDIVKKYQNGIDDIKSAIDVLVERGFSVDTLDITSEKRFKLEMVGFCGFYETMFSEYLDDGLNYDLENLHDSLSKLKINEFNSWYEWNFKQYQVDVADIVMRLFIEMATDLVGDIVKLNTTNKNAIVSSPKFYNFETDRISKQVIVSENDYNKLVGFLLGKKELAKQVIERHFTSYDGFTSFHPNTLEHWLNLEWNELTDLQFSYLFHCALCIRLYESGYYRKDNNGDTIDNINDVYDYAIRELENNAYDDLEMCYTDYVNLCQYHRELRKALDKENVVVSDECADTINDTLWALTECEINDKNELVKRGK